MTMSALFAELADIFAADVAFERHARAALRQLLTSRYMGRQAGIQQQSGMLYPCLMRWSES